MAFRANRLPAHRSTRCVMARVALPRAPLLLMTYRSGVHYGMAPLRASRRSPSRRHTRDRSADTRRFWFGGHRIGVWGRGRDLLRRKQLVDAGEFGFAMAVGKEAVMADALEAVGQNVEQKAADELGRCKRHELDERTVAVVLPTEGNVIIGDLDEAMIGDGDAVCIAA